MGKSLLEETTQELLKKFGAGNHKPGSGSAAAFQGMISAQLLITVINLTNENKRRKHYSHVLPGLLKMEKNTRERIFPELEKLFQEDSLQFDKTIKSREKRDQEKDLFKKNKLNRVALADLKISIDIPIKIAANCIELAGIAKDVFENGFQSARGDSQVALSGAVAGLGGCISIIHLNLLSFDGDDQEYSEKMFKIAKQIKEKYRLLNEISTSKIDQLEQELYDKSLFYKKINDIISIVKSKRNLSDYEIENTVRKIQNLVWDNKNLLWKKNPPNNYLDSLNASLVLSKVLNYDFHKDGVIDIGDVEKVIYKVAGLIDQENKLVLISNNYPKETQNFTIAHELGHAILHKQAVIHRDRPVDSSKMKGRNPQEVQADRFATYYLMPKKLVLAIFEDRFLTKEFEINELNTNRLVRNQNIFDLINKVKNLRGLARKLAGTTSYDNKHFKSMAEIFGVSVEAMAIRLEELNLIKF